MARTTKPKGVQIRTVRTKEDRKRPSVFMRLKTDEYFKAIALFEPDPEAEDNPGYFEYYDHYDKQGNSYVPCSGDQCPFCAANDNPSTRALTVWYFPENDEKDQIKVFTMNFGTTQDITDEAEEEGGILGKKVRIKRMSDKGDYKVRILPDKPLSKTELKKVMALVEEKFPNGLEAVVMKQLQAQLERLKALDALEDDDDDEDEEETPKARRGKAASDDDDEDEEDEEDEEEDDEEEEDEDEAESDDEDEDEDESEDEDEEEETEITGDTFTVVKFQEKDEILDVTDSDGAKIKMWVGEGVDVDPDEVKKGVTVTLDAQQDDEGDWIITDLTVKKATTRRRTTARKK